VVILDTNVLSALMRDRPERVVVAWLDGLAPESIWTTAVTVFEIRFGLELLPPGRRRTGLEADFHRLLEEDLERRILPFDQAAAVEAAAIAAAARAAGRPVEVQDVQIGGIARSRRAALATRNGRHFRDAGIPLIDPWQPSPRPPA
jgi:predicted nucleic acid-binding protein